MIVPAYLPYYVVTGTLGTIAALLFGLRSALGNAGWSIEDRTATLRAATITVVGWFLLALALASVRCLSYRRGSSPHDPARPELGQKVLGAHKPLQLDVNRTNILQRMGIRTRPRRRAQQVAKLDGPHVDSVVRPPVPDLHDVDRAR